MKPAFDLKSARLDALALRLHTADLADIRALLENRAAHYRKFADKPFVLDAGRLGNGEGLDIAAAVAVFAEHGLHVVGLKHSARGWREKAAQAGLLWLDGGRQPENEETPEETDTKTEQQQPENPNTEAEIPSVRRTLIVETPIRTGQQVYAEKADLIVLGMVSEGAEIIADGNIHVYAPMRGRALAGESGDKSARIFIQSMQAELVSIAGIYRVFEQNLPPSLHKKPVQVSLQVDGRLSVAAIPAQ